MGKIFSNNIAIPSIISLAVGGVMVMLLAYPLQAYVLWGVAFIWLLSFFVYSVRQRVTIDILSYELAELAPKLKNDFTITIEGFIQSRHPDGLKDIKLWLNPSLGFSSINALSNVPHSIDSKPRMFQVGYTITYEFVKHAMDEQQTDGVNIAWVLSADTRNADWLCYGGIIAPSFLEEKKVESMAAEGKMTRNTERREVGQLGINKKQFHNLLAKASQPIKKSEIS